MDRMMRLSSLWSWLPAFRVVAETEHLPTAAEIAKTSASSLSRSVKLLEEALGVELFERVGRRMALTDEGRDFLAAVRDGMRWIDDGIDSIQSGELHGPVHVASAGAITTAYVVPALQQLRRRHSGLVPDVRTLEPENVARKLLRGELDVAFQSIPLRDEQLTTTRLGKMAMGVYCGLGHPLHGVESVALDEVLEHEFVVPPRDSHGIVPDGWPPGNARRVGMHVDQMRLGCEACVSGQFLAVLPIAVARARGGGLWRIPIDVVPPTDVFAIHRKVIGTRRRLDTEVVAAVRARIADDG